MKKCSPKTFDWIPWKQSSKKNCFCLQLPNAKPLRLYKAKVTRGVRLIWEIAIAFSSLKSTPDRPIYTDVIRVWDIVLHDEVSLVRFMLMIFFNLCNDPCCRLSARLVGRLFGVTRREKTLYLFYFGVKLAYTDFTFLTPEILTPQAWS